MTSARTGPMLDDMRRRAAVMMILPGLILGGLAFLATPADAGFQGTFLIAKSKSGTYDGIRRANLDAGDAKTFYMKFNNTAGVSQDMTLSGEAFSMDLKPKWFKGFVGDTNITQAVKDGTYEFTVQSGQTKKFRVKVKALADGVEACVVTFAVDASMLQLGVTAAVNTDVCG